MHLTGFDCYSMSLDGQIKGRLKFERKGEQVEVQVIPLSPAEVFGKFVAETFFGWTNDTCESSHLPERVVNLTEEIKNKPEMEEDNGWLIEFYCRCVAIFFFVRSLFLRILKSCCPFKEEIANVNTPSKTNEIDTPLVNMSVKEKVPN